MHRLRMTVRGPRDTNCRVADPRCRGQTYRVRRKRLLSSPNDIIKTRTVYKDDEACYFIQATVLRTSYFSVQHYSAAIIVIVVNSPILSIGIGSRVQNHTRRRFQNSRNLSHSGESDNHSNKVMLSSSSCRPEFLRASEGTNNSLWRGE